MLKKLLVTIFFLLLVSTAIVSADINADDASPTYKPGDNIQTTITIYIADNYTDKVTIPIPRIYTVDQYSESPYGNEDINLEAYKYLTVEVRFEHLLTKVEYLCIYSYFDLSGFTLNFKEGIPTSKEISIFYFFQPPVGAFANNTSFIIENINDINLEGEDNNIFPEWFPILILVMASLTVVLFAFPFIFYMWEESSSSSSSSSSRRRQRLESEEDDYRTKSRMYQKSNSKPKPPVTFKCKGKKEIYELISGDGMFDIGVKKFNNMPSYEEQVNIINNLDEVISFTESTKHATVDLGKYGKYSIKIKDTPIVKRIESNGTRSDRNPYIGDHYELCMGSGKTLYRSCFKSKFYSECLRVIIELLKSEHGRGYRKWSDCGL